MTTFVRYSLFQIPGAVVAAAAAWAAQSWGVVSTGVACLAWAAWVAKDVAVYPLVKQAYERPRHGAEALAGLSGRVTVPLDPTGYVMVRGERWRAESSDDDETLSVGTSVVVEAVDGLVLRVRRRSDGNANGETASGC